MMMVTSSTGYHGNICVTMVISVFQKVACQLPRLSLCPDMHMFSKEPWKSPKAVGRPSLNSGLDLQNKFPCLGNV